MWGRVLLVCIVLAGGVGGSAGLDGAIAQSWPARQPIKVIVPFTAGSAVDVMARLVLGQVSRQIGRSFVVENRLGAGGTLGMAAGIKPN